MRNPKPRKGFPPSPIGLQHNPVSVPQEGSGYVDEPKLKKELKEQQKKIKEKNKNTFVTHDFTEMTLFEDERLSGL